jgi:ribosome-associated heat shock protein Hsp15
MAADRQRVDKWLFFARVVKSRTLAAKLAQGGHVRLNGAKIGQASRDIRIGDVLTVTLDRRVLVLKILDCGTRRGPAPEARLLYEDLSPPPLPKPDSRLDQPPGKRPAGAGRPTKKERRKLDRFAGHKADED